MEISQKFEKAIKSIGPLGKGLSKLLPEIEGLERELNLRQRKIDELTAVNRLAPFIARIESQKDVDEVLKRLLKVAIKLSHAGRGLIILIDDAAEDGFSIRASASVEEEGTGEDIVFSRSLIKQILQRGEHIVTTNVKQDERFESGESLLATNIRSVMATPIKHQDDIIGALYVDSHLSEYAFNKDDLEIFNTFANHAAVVLTLATSLSIQRELQQELVENLEKRVKKRTAQLEKANKEILSLNEMLKEENLRMGAELKVAQRLQKMILPTEQELLQVKELDIAGYMDVVDEVGGDYYDVLQHGNKVKLGIGDVTGHGLESGVLMLMTQAAVRTLLNNGEEDPVRFLEALNHTIFDNVERMKTDKNLTLSLIDYEKGVMKVYGQHEEIILVRGDGEIELIDTMDLGLPVGLSDDISQFVAQKDIYLEPNDGIVIYTDGITEAENMSGEQYGLEKLCDIVKQNWHESADNIKNFVVEDVYSHIGEQVQYDDITLLVAKRKPV